MSPLRSPRKLRTTRPISIFCRPSLAGRHYSANIEAVYADGRNKTSEIERWADLAEFVKSS